MKTFRGVDLTQMPAFVKTPKEGRVLLLDGDAAAYRAAATVAKLPTAVNKFWTLVLEEMYVTEASQAIVHLTSHDCTKLNRKFYPTAKPYQGNRVGKAKPPLLEPLREGLVREVAPDGVAVVLNREMEADDAIIEMGYNFSDVVISSADKDLRQTIHPYFESATGQISRIDNTDGWVGIKHTPSGVAKLTGHGWFFLLAQWLAGDPADNVAGLLSYKGSKVGVVKAVKLLQEWGDFNESVHNIIKAYARIKQDALAELAMIFLHRHPSDTAWSWLVELGYDDYENDKYAKWLYNLHHRHVRIIKRSLAHDEDGEDTATSVDA